MVNYLRACIITFWYWHIGRGESDQQPRSVFTVQSYDYNSVLIVKEIPRTRIKIFLGPIRRVVFLMHAYLGKKVEIHSYQPLREFGSGSADLAGLPAESSKAFTLLLFYYHFLDGWVEATNNIDSTPNRQTVTQKQVMNGISLFGFHQEGNQSKWTGKETRENTPANRKKIW